MWEYGGIVTDIETVPGIEFENSDVVASDDECVLEYKGDKNVNTRFIACRPKHLFLYTALQRSIGSHLLQFNEAGDNRTYTAARSDIYNFAVNSQFVGKKRKGRSKIYKQLGDKIKGVDRQTLVIIDDSSEHNLLTSKELSMAAKETFSLLPSGREDCIDFNKDSNELDMESLLDLVGEDNVNTSCPEGQRFMRDAYNPQSIVKGRKIPRIIHMTSKSRCMTQAYADNIDLWRFDGYSLFLHDDIAVNRLLNQTFPEFPLLRDVKHCITSGAGLADLWRYLVLWVYGGIYTDIDNAPGYNFTNGTIITDDVDSLFEVEMVGFPRYVFAYVLYISISFSSIQS